MADFSNFELEQLKYDDGVGGLSDGIVRDTADIFRVSLSDRPNADELSELVDQIRSNKVLEGNIQNIEKRIPLNEKGINQAADLVERSGVQLPLSRSLWTPEITADEIDNVVIMGGVANWMDRMENMLLRDAESEYFRKVVLVTGNRTMTAKTELVNPRVIEFKESIGREPHETEYAKKYLVPSLSERGHTVKSMTQNTTGGGELALQYANYQESLGHSADEPVAFLRVANAGVQMAIQYRDAIRTGSPGFDNVTVGGAHQAFIRTDGFRMARTQDQIQDPTNYQNPITALGQVVLAAKLLQKTADELRLA